MTKPELPAPITAIRGLRDGLEALFVIWGAAAAEVAALFAGILGAKAQQDWHFLGECKILVGYQTVTDQGRDDFLNEAQDIIEAFARNLLAIDAAHKRGVAQPELINEAFREVHTLKGLSSLFGARGLSGLTHKLEDLLDGLRLGRLDVSAPVLDVLFSAVDIGHQLLANPESDQDSELQAKVGRVTDAITSLSASADRVEVQESSIDPAILGVLTEYEEHRLRANIDAGQRLFRVRVQFDLMTIDSELSALKDSARQLGEVITYLPTGEATAPDILELDLVLASSQPLSAVTALLGSDNAVVHEIPVERGGSQHSGSTRSGTPRSVAGSAFAIPSMKPIVGISEAPRKSHLIAAQTNEQRLARRAVRVDIYKLDRLMNVVGELSILKTSLYENAESIRLGHSRQLGGELHRLHRVLERRLEDLQNGILEMRMVPLGQMFDRLARGVRQISRDLGKEVRLVVTGAETEIDKLIVEELGDPLLHMLRNAIDHGIEEASEREKARKSNAGTIALNAYQKGSHVLIEVEDDGRGVNEEKLIARAVATGAIEEAMASNLSRDELLGLMFLPGLSTREDVSEVSGRGVGMDVVKTNIARLGGVIDVQSERGIGTKMTLTLPVTLAIFRALLVNVERQQFAVPLSAISEVNLLDQGTREVDGREMTSLRGTTLPLCRLRSFFSLSSEKSAQKEFVVVAQVGERRLGLVVDSIAGQQDIVIKTLGASLARVRGFSGATELGNQKVGLVLDVAAILEEMLSPGDTLRKVAHG